MSDKKNIDRLFQEKFKDFEAQPSKNVWIAIENELTQKKKRRVIPLWWKFSGVAALLIFGTLGFNHMLNNKKVNDNKNPIVIENKTPQDSSFIEERIIKNGEVVTEKTSDSELDVIENKTVHELGLDKTLKKDIDVKNRINIKTIHKERLATSSEVEKAEEKSSHNFPDKVIEGEAIANNKLNNKKAVSESAVASPSKKEAEKASNNYFDTEKSKTSNNNENKAITAIEKSTAIDKKETVTLNETPLKKDETNSVAVKTDKNNNIEVPISIKNDSTAVAMKTVEPNALEELLNEKEKQIESQESKMNRWQIAPNIAPVYFNSSTNGSPIASEFENNSKSYDNNISFGLGVNYAVNSKFTVRSGVNRVTLSYNTNDVVFYANLNNEGMRNIRQNVSGSMIVVEDEPQFSINSIDENIGINEGSLNQSFGYVEVPLEFSYKLLDKKFGVQFIGGMSTLFLTQNSVAIISDVATTTFGEANNLNNIHFSGNVGIGFNYGFSKSFQFNFEPMLKYQLNTFSSDSGNFKPYFIGLYSGISYRF